MHIMKVLLSTSFFLSIILTGLEIHSQPCNNNGNDVTKYTGAKPTGTYTPHTTGLEERHYLHDWAKGQVFYSTGDIVNQIYLRYDCTNDNILWMRNNDFKIAILHTDHVRKIQYKTAQNKTVVLEKKYLPGIAFATGETFMHLMAKGNVSLYKIYKYERIPNSKEIHKKNAYIVLKEGHYHHLKTKKRSLKEIFNQNQQAITALLQKNNFDLTQEKDLIRVFDLINNSFMR